jgi:RNA polymerase sigma-70 factor, ECF subfamily
MDRSTELSRLIASGDRSRAASLLVKEYAPAVFSLCRAMVRDSRLAEDLSQDAFARAFAALDGFRGEASPRTWLLKIARNRCLDHLDRLKRAPWGGEEPEPDALSSDEPAPFDLLSRRQDAERAMAVLAEGERALVVLHFGHGVGYPELADSFGIREGAVRMRISRALARMRAALARTDAELARSDAEAVDREMAAAPAPPMPPSSQPVSRARAARAAPPTFPALRDDLPASLCDRLADLAAALG